MQPWSPFVDLLGRLIGQFHEILIERQMVEGKAAS